MVIVYIRKELKTIDGIHEYMGWVGVGGFLEDRPTYQQTDRPTYLGIKEPGGSIKNGKIPFWWMGLLSDQFSVIIFFF